MDEATVTNLILQAQAHAEANFTQRMNDIVQTTQQQLLAARATIGDQARRLDEAEKELQTRASYAATAFAQGEAQLRGEYQRQCSAAQLLGQREEKIRMQQELLRQQAEQLFGAGAATAPPTATPERGCVWISGATAIDGDALQARSAIGRKAQKV